MCLIFYFDTKKVHRLDIDEEIDWSYLQHFADVGGAEDFVDNGELVGVVGGEIGGEDAVFGAAAAQELA